MIRALLVSSLAAVLLPMVVFGDRIAQHTHEDITPNFGAIEGRVLDARGQPVTGVKVYCMVLGHPPMGRRLSAYTDNQGEFFLDTVEPGTNEVYTAKEDEGYPDTASPFANPLTIPKILVREHQITRGVEVKLGPKGGKLVVRIVDATTNKPISTATMVLYAADNPANSFSSGPNKPDGEFQFLVPSVPLRIKITSPGYEDWWYTESNGSAKPGKILLSPGSVRGLSISLRPAKER